eukprot:5275701-Amphidinium_carterae.1
MPLAFLAENTVTRSPQGSYNEAFLRHLPHPLSMLKRLQRSQSAQQPVRPAAEPNVPCKAGTPLQDTGLRVLQRCPFYGVWP